MSTESNTFSNDNVQLTVSRHPGSKVKMDITVSPLATQAAYKKAIKEINKEVSIPGFRKGKAPDSYIMKNYADHIEKEWKNILLNTSFQEAINLAQIYPLNKEGVDNVQLKEISQEKGAKLVIDFEADPEIPDVKIEELTVKKEEPAAVTEAQKEEVIAQIKLSHATWEDLKDTPIAAGDYVDLDIYNLDSNFDICKGSRFCVEPGKLGNWLINLLTGKKVGDVVEGLSQNENEEHAKTCTDPTHDHSHDEDFKETNCRVTVTNHLKAILPELDDALAQKSGAPNLEELHKRIEQSLSARNLNVIKQKQAQEIEAQLIEKYPFELPASLVKPFIDSRVRHMLSHYEGNPSDDEVTSIKAAAAKEADVAFRMRYITDKIAKDHQIEVTQDEIMQEFMKQMMNPQGSYINQGMKPEEIRLRLETHLIGSKTMELLLKHAKQID